ncbi:helix-turn-helix domain-containing protein [Streptomyces sp. NPDC059994]|uniref:helix-turn-helix domain-containing protein n=1 Tax=Streptomyces sp. NPDC059994 TaxID=3347029 RepID=UPI0036C8529F
MPPRPIEIGPAGQAVARAIESTRAARGYSQRQLASRVTALGRPMTFSAVSRIERRVRRCDIDDLVAIAAALDVAPNVLFRGGVQPSGPVGGAQYSRRSPVSETGDSVDH